MFWVGVSGATYAHSKQFEQLVLVVQFGLVIPHLTALCPLILIITALGQFHDVASFYRTSMLHTSSSALCFFVIFTFPSVIEL